MQDGAGLVIEGHIAVLASVPLQVFLVEAVFGDVIQSAVGANPPSCNRTTRNSSAAAAPSANSTNSAGSGPRSDDAFCVRALAIGVRGILGYRSLFGHALWSRAETTPTIRNMSASRLGVQHQPHLLLRRRLQGRFARGARNVGGSRLPELGRSLRMCLGVTPSSAATTYTPTLLELVHGIPDGLCRPALCNISF